jgi:hypothetical protein
MAPRKKAPRKKAPQKKPRKRKAEKASERISPTEALRILLPHWSAHRAAERLTDAVHANDCRLWKGDTPMRPEIAAKYLVIVARADKDGRWQAHVEGREEAIWRTEDFTFEADEVRALLRRAEAEPPSAEPQQLELHRSPGKPPKKDWHVRVAVELGRRWERGEEPTAPDMCRWCSETWNVHVDEGDMRRLMSRAAKKK